MEDIQITPGRERRLCGSVEIETVTVLEVVPLKGRLTTSHRLLASRIIDQFLSLL